MRKFKKVVNLTPHSITIVNNGRSWTIEPSGVVLRAVEFDSEPFQVVVEEIGLEAVGVVRRYGAPQEGMLIVNGSKSVHGRTYCYYGEPDTLYLVSLPLMQVLAASGIFVLNFAAPDTGKGAIRNEQGQIVAVKGLIFVNGEEGE